VYDYLPFTKPSLYFELKRVNATTWRPPDLGTYLLGVSGFMFSYMITGKKWYKYMPFLMVVFLSVVSKSRTALVAIFIQLLFLMYLSYRYYPSFRRWVNKALVVLFFFLTT